VFDGKSLRATAVRRGLAGGEGGAGVSGLHTIASRGFPRVAGSKEHALGGGGRRGEVGAGAGAAMAAWQWCRRPIPVRERAGMRATAARTRKAHTTVRVGVTARLVPAATGCRGVERGRAQGHRHGWRRARHPRSAHERACMVRPVVRCVRGGQEIGVPPLGDRVCGLSGHGKARATRAS
jgi:hypothetical protein